MNVKFKINSNYIMCKKVELVHREPCYRKRRGWNAFKSEFCKISLKIYTCREGLLRGGSDVIHCNEVLRV